jgi:hypothetical protein
MHHVYNFFGFGPNFIKLLETMGNYRTACIAFEDGSYSKEIDLECGRAQGNGNTSSPVEYNMAQQIVLFKIELSPEIKIGILKPLYCTSLSTGSSEGNPDYSLSRGPR